jgi:N-carbamoyl-L-amino-acid hydrolase
MTRFRQAIILLAALAAPGTVLAQPAVNGPRLNAHLEELSQFGRNAQGGVTRVAYTEEDRQGRAYVMDLMRKAGLEVRLDAAGNIVGRRAGLDDTLPPIAMGSHIDSVPEGGRYDGCLGSLGAIEVVQTLVENGIRTRHPIEVLIFQNEENGQIGSKAVSGELQDKELDLTNASGKTRREGTAFIDGDPATIATARRKPGDFTAYVELHIEQGGILDQKKIDIGVVQGIVGIGRWMVTVEGDANHAGTTPMDQRKDALVAAARFITAANRVAIETPGRHVITVGQILVEPNAPNVIPGKVDLSLEIRDLDRRTIEDLFQKLVLETQGSPGAFRWSVRKIYENAPALTDDRIRQMVDTHARALGLTTLAMPSGAGHDAQSIARLAPMGMVFIPSVGGYSHSAKENSTPEAIANGANVLLRTLVELDGKQLSPRRFP